MAARTGVRTGLSPPALASDSSALDHSATEGTKLNNVNTDKIAGSEPCWVVNPGIYSSSGGAGAVPVMHFERKVASLLVT